MKSRETGGYFVQAGDETEGPPLIFVCDKHQIIIAKAGKPEKFRQSSRRLEIPPQPIEIMMYSIKEEPADRRPPDAPHRARSQHDTLPAPIQGKPGA